MGDVTLSQRSALDGPLRDERAQSVTAFFAVVMVALFAVCGLVIDGGRQASAARQADAAARQAARAGAQAMTASAVQGGATTVDPAQGRLAAQAWLRTAGVPGTVTVTGNQVTVTTRLETDTVFLSVIGVSRLSATGTSTAEATRVVNGTPR